MRIKRALSESEWRLVQQIREQEIPEAQVDRVIENGMLIRLLEAEHANIDRAKFDWVCGVSSAERTARATRAARRIIPTIGEAAGTVELGIYTHTGVYREKIRAIGGSISSEADQVFEKIKISRDMVTLDLYVLSGEDLGFTDCASRADIYRKAFESGFIACPAEAGPAYRLVCESYRHCLVGMEALTGNDGKQYIFCIGNGGSRLCLDAVDGRLEELYHQAWKWIFTVPW